MIVDLDDERSLDPGRVGAKAAWLARGRRARLPVLPGFVIEARASAAHLRLGEETLERRGSGGARLAVTEEPLGFEDELITRGARLGPTLVARSSTTLEASGAWSGAFTSYLDLAVDELPRGVVGCWASVFSVATLERLGQAGLSPSSVSMAVVVQPALEPDTGGKARLDSDGAVTVFGIAGSPAPLLQGWVSGERARRDNGWQGEALIALAGEAVLDLVADGVRRAAGVLGATECEWAAVDGEVWLLQLGERTPVVSGEPSLPTAGLDDPALVALARVVSYAPGPLGESLVLPWALGGALPEIGSHPLVNPGRAVSESRDLCARLAAGVWAAPEQEAEARARDCISRLRGPDPASALDQIRALVPPDPDDAGRLLGLLAWMRLALVERGAAGDESSAWYLTVDDAEFVLGGGRRPRIERVGVGGWEPYLHSVVMASGAVSPAVPASSGFGAGRRSHIAPPERDGFRPRDAITADQPVPGLAPLLWDAACLATTSGSPAAHLFESARALGVPAVCGADLPVGEEMLVALDGHSGVVGVLDLGEVRG